MTELPEQLRRLVDSAATPVTADEIRNRTAAPLGTTPLPGSWRNQRRWPAVAAAFVLVAGGGAVIALREGGDRITTKLPPESTSTTAVVDVEGPVMEVLDGDMLLDIASDTPRTIRSLIGVDASNAPVTRTPDGIIATARTPDGRNTNLVIYRDDKDLPEVLVPDVIGFAVNADATQVVYSQRVTAAPAAPGAPDRAGQPSASTTITVATLPDLRVTWSVAFRGFGGSDANAIPVGWAGPYVMLNTGDGAGSRSAYWRPGSATVTPIAFGTVQATDPFRPQALIARNDGTCVDWETITDQGAVPAIDGSRGCGPVAISLSGTRMARAGDDGTLSVIDLATNRVDWTWSLDLELPRQRVLDVHWTHEDTVVVGGRGFAGVCQVRTDCRIVDLVDVLVSRYNVPSLVELRPISSKAAEVPMPTTTLGPFVDTTPPLLADTLVAVTSDSLHIVNARTGQPTRRIDVLETVRKLSTDERLQFVEVSPDKQSAIVTTTPERDSRYSLWFVDLVTAQVRLVRTGAIWPAFSPDGTKLAYVLTAGPATGGDTIVVRDLATGSERELKRPGVAGLSKVDGVVWSPDNRTIAYSYGYYGFDTYLVDTATATDLNSDRVLADVSPIAWPETGVLVVNHFCCDEAEPPTQARYVISTGQRFPLSLAGTGFVDLNEQDGRSLGRTTDPDTQRYVIEYTGSDGRSLRLAPAYVSASW